MKPTIMTAKKFPFSQEVINAIDASCEVLRFLPRAPFLQDRVINNTTDHLPGGRRRRRRRRLSVHPTQEEE